MPTHKKSILIFIIGFLSQGVLADPFAFKVIETNVPKYRLGYTLSKSTEIELGQDQFLALKVPNRSEPFYIKGPYDDTKLRQISQSPTLTNILMHIATVAEEKKCEWDSVAEIFRCITAPIAPRAETQTSDKQLVKEVLDIVLQRVFPRIAPTPKSRMSDNTQYIEMPADPWLLVASWDKNFCYQPNQSLTIWQPDSLADKLVLLARSTDKQPIKKGVYLDDVFVITLHPMPDDNTLPSDTYKAVWMAGKGCYRQAQLLLSPPKK